MDEIRVKVSIGRYNLIAPSEVSGSVHIQHPIIKELGGERSSINVSASEELAEDLRNPRHWWSEVVEEALSAANYWSSDRPLRMALLERLRADEDLRDSFDYAYAVTRDSDLTKKIEDLTEQRERVRKVLRNFQRSEALT